MENLQALFHGFAVALTWYNVPKSETNKFTSASVNGLIFACSDWISASGGGSTAGTLTYPTDEQQQHG